MASVDPQRAYGSSEMTEDIEEHEEVVEEQAEPQQQPGLVAMAISVDEQVC